MENNQEPVRRRFLKWLTGLFLSFWGVAVVGAVASYLKTPGARRSAALNAVRAGDADSLAAGDARLIRHGNSPLYVVRLAGGELTAVSALCTHFRCVLKWNAAEKTLACPCHNGTFNAAGEVISGLPTKALHAYPVEVRQGEIVVLL